MAEIETRVALVEAKITDIEGEQLRTRTRLHDLESDRAMMRLFVQQTKELTHQMGKLAAEAARQAVDMAFKERGIYDSAIVKEIKNDLRSVRENQIEQEAVAKAIHSIRRYAVTTSIALAAALAATGLVAVALIFH